MGIITKIFGTANDRELKRLGQMVAQINALEPRVKALRDEQISARAREIKADIRAVVEEFEDDENLPAMVFAKEAEHLAEVFALTREASVRCLGMRPFDVQLVGGIVLWEGKIAEMKTGEGKTLAATMPLTLHGMSGLGAHLVTVNDYLAKRDAEWMGPIYQMMGLTVGLCVQEVEPDERQASYRADITYGTNNEFGFDYLRDNLKVHASQLVQRRHHFAIVDEVDSILIDEARTPLIISGPVRDDPTVLMRVRDVVRKLQRDKHYEVDEKHRNVMLNDEGVEAVQRDLGVENLYDDEQGELLHRVENMVRAYALYKRDKDYIVKGREVILVDEHTGRTLHGRRLSEGLHQAIEAKENVRVRAENQTYATISLQNYFRMYDRLAGMTGTADTEAVEFKKIYNLDIVIIPTNMPMIRDDEPDKVYLTAGEKFAGLYLDIVDCHLRGQPILVGTASVEMSELVSDLLHNKRKERQVREILDRDIIGNWFAELNEATGRDYDPKIFKVPHTVLNAKQHEAEALVVAQGGRAGSVTIATNMAGRGTDIKLGGDPEKLIFTEELVSAKASKKQIDAAVAERAKQCAAERAQVLELGGLRVIAAERHESRRIDNQLRGRSGRQGDPGSSCFYLSLEDDLLRIFGERTEALLSRLQMEKDVPIVSHRLMDRAIERAQKAVEGHNFDIRKRLLEYDDVMNQQRTVIYKIRNKILRESDVHDEILDMAEEVGGSIALSYTAGMGRPEEWDLLGLQRLLKNRYGIARDWHDDEKFNLRADPLAEEVAVDMRAALEKRYATIQKIDSERYRAIEDHSADKEKLLQTLLKQVAFGYIERFIPEELPPKKWNYDAIAGALRERYNFTLVIEDAAKDNMSWERLLNYIAQHLSRRLEEDRYAIEPNIRDDWEIVKVERQRRLIMKAEQRTYLWAIDHHWQRHLWHMDHLREAVGFSGYAQRNPLLEYKREGFKLFDEMIWNIKKMTINALFRLGYDGRSGRIVLPDLTDISDEAKQVKDETTSYKEAMAAQQDVADGPSPDASPKGVTVRREAPKVGRNEPCPCGSGKKYKHCCWDKDHRVG